MRICLKQFAPCLLLAFLLTRTAWADYEASGRLTYIAYATNGSVEARAERLFTISNSNCFWIIHTTDALEQGPLEKRRGPLYWEKGSDGTNTFSIWVANTNYVGQYYQIRVGPDGTDERVAREGKFEGANVAGGMILPGAVPAEDSTFDNVVWLALASSCYLDRAKDSLRPMWPLGPDYGEDVSFKAEWRRNRVAPFLPITITYFDDTLRIGTEKGIVTIKAEAPWTVAKFESFGFANVSGLAIPTRFSLTRFSSPQRTSADRRVVTTVDGNVDRISRKTTVESFKPILPGPTLITDHRFDPILGGRKAVTVMLRHWKSDEDLQELDEYIRLSARVPFPTMTQLPTSRLSLPHFFTNTALVIIAISLGAAAVGSGILAILKYRKSKRQGKPK